MFLVLYSSKSVSMSQTLEALVLAQQKRIATLEARLSQSQIAHMKIDKRTVHAEFKDSVHAEFIDSVHAEFRDSVLYIRYDKVDVVNGTKKYVHIYLEYSKPDQPHCHPTEDSEQHVYRCFRIAKHPDRDAPNAVYDGRTLDVNSFWAQIYIWAKLEHGGCLELFHNLRYSLSDDWFLSISIKKHDRFDFPMVDEEDRFRFPSEQPHIVFSKDAVQRFQDVLWQAIDAWGIKAWSIEEQH